MTERVYLQPLWIRLWHWSNALLILALAVSGASVHFADPKGGLLEFSAASSIHSFAGLVLVALYAAFVIGNLISGNGRHFLPAGPDFLGRCLAQGRYYLWGVLKGEPKPQGKTTEKEFNPLQALVYCVVMYGAMPVVAVTGLVFLYPQLAPARAFGLHGLLPVAVVHYATAALIVAFMIAHIYLGTMGTRVTSLFKTMITGWHEH